MAGSKKGAKIKFVGGVHKGSGWIDQSKNPSPDYTYVIVNKKDKDGKSWEMSTKVKHENYLLFTELNQPANYEEAMVDQCDDIDKLLNQLARKMARCEMVDGKGSQSAKNIANILIDRVDKAVKEQRSKGDGALWKRVRWKSA
jgi:hypothetical protein